MSSACVGMETSISGAGVVALGVSSAASWYRCIAWDLKVVFTYVNTYACMFMYIHVCMLQVVSICIHMYVCIYVYI